MAQPVTSLPLSRLRPGHEAEPPVNIRVSGGPSSDIGPLAANIADRIAAGRPPLIEPLLVVEGPKTRGEERLYYVCDGGRRLAALSSLAEAGTIPADIALPVVEHAKAEGLEVSTTAAVMAAPHHPVEQYEAFAALAALRGDRPEADTVDFLARRFAMSHRQVRQIRALGALAPEVRAAWRAGKLDRSLAEAFTLEPDHGRQAQVLEELRKSHSLYTYAIRQALLAERVETTDARVDMVGLDTYLAAGGTLSGDLFSDRRYIQDVALLERLHQAAREAIAQRFRAEGWGYVFWERTAEAAGYWHWTQIEAENPVWTDEARAACDRLEAEIVALEASRKAALAAPRPEDSPLDEDDWEDYDEEEEPDADEPRDDEEYIAPSSRTLTLNDQLQLAKRERDRLTREAKAAGIPREARADLAVVLRWVHGHEAEPGYIHAQYGYIPPGLDSGKADGEADDEADADLGDDTAEAAAPPVEPETTELPRAALQALSEIANRAAAATLSGDGHLALAVLAAAWIARNGDRFTMHDEGRMAPIVVTTKGLGHGRPAAERGKEDRRTFGAIVDEVAGLSLKARLSLLAELVASALAIDESTLASTTSEGRDRRVSRQAARMLIERLPTRTYERHAQLLLAADAEGLFREWPKATLIEALREIDGDEAADHAAKAKKPAIVQTVADRARKTGWLPPALRGKREAATVDASETEEV